MQRQKIVLIGNGMVGQEFLAQCVSRELNIRFSIEVFGAEPRPAYDRIRLNDCVVGKNPETLQFHDQEWYDYNGIYLHTGDPITAIDREAQCVHSASGQTVSYDYLVFATGSRAYMPPIEGGQLEGVYTYRTVEDAQAIGTAALQSKRVTIVGGGLLGLELAKTIQDMGTQVEIVAYQGGLMVRQLNVVGSDILRQHMESSGIEIRFNQRTKAIVPNGKDADTRFTIHFESGEQAQTDMVVVATGIRPIDDLAQAADLRCSPRGGISIDDHLRTSDPHIFAIGECAVWQGDTFGLVAPGYHMAEILAQRLGGDEEPAFAGFDLSTRLKIAGLDLYTLGQNQGEGTSYRWRVGQSYRNLLVRNGRLVGATLIGSCTETARIQDAVKNREHIGHRQCQRFVKSGVLFPEQSNDPRLWPELATICSCKNVSRGTISALCEQGPCSVADVGDATGAGTVCGSCQPLITRIVQDGPVDEAEVSSSSDVALKWLSIGAIIFAAVFVAFDLPIRQSVVVETAYSELWTDGFLRQVSGFTILGLGVVAMLFSARKRMPALKNLGNFGAWRLFHAAVAVIAVIGLALHTGLRLGHNANFLLIACFLALVVFGAQIGWLMQSPLAHSRIGRWCRLWFFRVHVALTWTLIPLLVFHVVSVYAY